MKSGTFKLNYGEKELTDDASGNGIKIVNKANLPSYALNQSEKVNCFDISPIFTQLQGKK